jgi:hypothetical protein
MKFLLRVILVIYYSVIKNDISEFGWAQYCLPSQYVQIAVLLEAAQWNLVDTDRHVGEMCCLGLYRSHLLIFVIKSQYVFWEKLNL